MCKICIFAGTVEGRKLMSLLSARGAQIAVCVATEYGQALLGDHPDVRIYEGRMEESQMETFLRGEAFDVVVDATHPYAARVTENIAATCRAVRTEYLRLLRNSAAGGEDGVFVSDAGACVEYLMATCGKILLTTGSKELPVFCGNASLRDRLYARVLPVPASVQTCVDCGIPPDHILAMLGPFDEEMNFAMLRSTGAEILVTKDTGDEGGYAAKLRAAERAGVRTVVIGRPAQREGKGLEETIRYLETRLPLKPVLKRVSLIGIGMGNSETRTLGMERALREADCLIGARRMLESVDTSGRQAFAAGTPDEVVRIIQENGAFRRIAILLSGDTGFYSGARGLLDKLSSVEVEVLPGISSIQYFCAKLRRSWEDVRAVSLHGRDCDLVGEVRRNAAVFALVGGSDGVGRALGRLKAAKLGGLRAHVGERLGYPDEKITSGTVDALLERRYDALGVLLIENESNGETVVTHGLPDEAFERGDIPMTKSEVRSVSLSKLQLTREATVYDIGSGSGSVSVEAALVASGGRVYAVEMREEAVALTRRNAEKFHLANVETVPGKAPGALEALPPPTHAFIGGSAGNLREIVVCLLHKNPNVRIVANTVTVETLSELMQIAKEFDFYDVAELAVSKPRIAGRYHLMTAQNPVYIFAMQNGGNQK